MKLKDCREIFNILNQKVKVKRILNTWGYEMPDRFEMGYSTKKDAEISYLKQIIADAKQYVKRRKKMGYYTSYSLDVFYWKDNILIPIDIKDKDYIVSVLKSGNRDT